MAGQAGGEHDHVAGLRVRARISLGVLRHQGRVGQGLVAQATEPRDVIRAKQ
jgi:hypothetical protein